MEFPGHDRRLVCGKGLVQALLTYIRRRQERAMEASVLGVALAALVTALVALVRTARNEHRAAAPEPSVGSTGKARTEAPDPTVDERGRRSQPGWGGFRGVDCVAPDNTVVLWLPNSRKSYSSRLTADWFCRVVPRACGATAMMIVVVIFGLQNSQAVTLRFLDWQVEGVPLAPAILLCGALGAAIATAFWLVARRELIERAHRLEGLLRSAESGRRRRSGKPTPRPSSVLSPGLGSIGPA
jgi:uncharacterized integral membrane protein